MKLFSGDVMKKSFVLSVVLLPALLCGYTPTNMSWGYDRSFTRLSWLKKHVSLKSSFEYMLRNRCYGPDQTRVSATQIYGTHESALAMLEGFEPGSDLNLLANRVRATQDGVRGVFITSGSFKAWKASIDTSVNLSAITLPGDFTFSLHVPFQKMALQNVRWTSLTKNQSIHDAMVRSHIAADQAGLQSFSQENASLNLGDVERVGLGDISALFDWKCCFLHNHNRLTEVLVNLRAGVSLPTGHVRNNDVAFDLSFGHDETFGIPLGAGLQLGLSRYFAAGIDVGTLLLVRRSKEWRLMNGWGQTEHLFPRKGLATKEYGPEWDFTLYGRVREVVPGAFVVAGYQFIKHADSTLYEQDKSFSPSLINRSEQVESCESHNLFCDITWSKKDASLWRVSPEFACGVKIPFGGKRMMSGVLVRVSGTVRF